MMIFHTGSVKQNTRGSPDQGRQFLWAPAHHHRVELCFVPRVQPSVNDAYSHSIINSFAKSLSGLMLSS